ncbi:uncharacterized protein LOC111721248 [Sarcophilus harrisii]|uniref:uncharacterized protein LOC111721248 n=1 Tax=Sarcophilus harrisii TaxID=9305 RepID=UPI000C7E4C9E|nr:uncharacterized protein LOC111721248 [Sarcophilus harrisii]
MSLSGSALPFISTSMITTGKDPRKVALTTIVEYVTKRNGARNMNSVQIQYSSPYFPKNSPSPLRFSQSVISEKMNTLASASKNHIELDNKMKEHILPKIQPLLQVTAPIKKVQNAKKKRLKSQPYEALLHDFRQNIKTIKSLMNPESNSNKVVGNENKDVDCRKRIRHEQVHLFSSFAEASCERAEEIKLLVTGNSYPKHKTKLTAEQN